MTEELKDKIEEVVLTKTVLAYPSLDEIDKMTVSQLADLKVKIVRLDDYIAGRIRKIIQR